MTTSAVQSEDFSEQVRSAGTIKAERLAVCEKRREMELRMGPQNSRVPAIPARGLFCTHGAGVARWAAAPMRTHSGLKRREIRQHRTNQSIDCEDFRGISFRSTRSVCKRAAPMLMADWLCSP
jgi:hypothetical protein